MAEDSVIFRIIDETTGGSSNVPPPTERPAIIPSQPAKPVVSKPTEDIRTNPILDDFFAESLFPAPVAKTGEETRPNSLLDDVFADVFPKERPSPDTKVEREDTKVLAPTPTPEPITKPEQQPTVTVAPPVPPAQTTTQSVAPVTTQTPPVQPPPIPPTPPPVPPTGGTPSPQQVIIAGYTAQALSQRTPAAPQVPIMVPIMGGVAPTPGPTAQTTAPTPVTAPTTKPTPSFTEELETSFQKAGRSKVSSAITAVDSGPVGQTAGKGAAGAMSSSVAGAVGAIGLAGDLVTGFNREAQDAIRGIGGVTSSLVRGNNVQAFTKGLDFAEKSLNKIPIVGEALSSALGTVNTSVKAFGDVLDAINARADELAAYSPQISSAKAFADVRQTRADMNEAQVLGPQMAEMITAQSEMSVQFQEMLLPIKEVLLGEIVDLMKGAKEIMGVVAGTGQELKTVVQTGVWMLKNLTPAGWLFSAIQGLGKTAEALPGNIAKEQAMERQIQNAQEYIDKWLGRKKDSAFGGGDYGDDDPAGGGGDYGNQDGQSDPTPEFMQQRLDEQLGKLNDSAREAQEILNGLGIR